MESFMQQINIHICQNLTKNFFHVHKSKKTWLHKPNFDHNKRIILLLFLPMGMGLCKTDTINQMITLSVITLSSFHCIVKRTTFLTKIVINVFTWSAISSQEQKSQGNNHFGFFGVWLWSVLKTSMKCFVLWKRVSPKNLKFLLRKLY